MSVLEKILTFFYPKRCLLCGRAGAVNEDELCADCAKLQPDIRVRFFALHAGRRDYTLECRAPQRYKEPFRSSLWRFKFKNGTMKYILRSTMSRYVPEQVMNRTDKMGFPTPFAVWAKGECRDFICDTLSTTKARQREYVDNAKVISKINGEGAFSRSLWGFFCLELWQQIFHDKANEYRERLNTV